MKFHNRNEDLKINELVDLKINLKIFNKNNKVYQIYENFIIGGEQIYRLAIKNLNINKIFTTEIYKKMVENQIKSNPSYYFWTHRRFKHEKSSLT